MVSHAERRHTPRPAVGSNMKLWKDLSDGPSEQTAEWGGHRGSLRGKYGLGDTRPGVEILRPVKDLDFLLRVGGAGGGRSKKQESYWDNGIVFLGPPVLAHRQKAQQTTSPRHALLPLTHRPGRASSVITGARSATTGTATAQGLFSPGGFLDLVPSLESEDHAIHPKKK